MINRPDYKRIFHDMLSLKYPERMKICQKTLDKANLNNLDVIRLNRLMVQDSEQEDIDYNQKLKSYDKTAIFKILDYQVKHKLSNVQLARHFNMSRNTVTKWKRNFY